MIMNKLIACCGLNCETCEARIATVKDDDQLRKSTVEKWSTMYNSQNLTIDMINCTGCREDGVKYFHCNDCEIRKCVDLKGFNTCGECADIETCAKVSMIHKYVPEALSNLVNPG
jgi:hypothetical protein